MTSKLVLKLRVISLSVHCSSSDLWRISNTFKLFIRNTLTIQFLVSPVCPPWDLSFQKCALCNCQQIVLRWRKQSVSEWGPTQLAPSSVTSSSVRTDPSQTLSPLLNFCELIYYWRHVETGGSWQQHWWPLAWCRSSGGHCGHRRDQDQDITSHSSPLSSEVSL